MTSTVGKQLEYAVTAKWSVFEVLLKMINKIVNKEMFIYF